MSPAGLDRRLVAWIAAFAVMLAAVAPSVSRAIGSDPSRFWVEVCSAQGSRWLPVADAGESDPSTAPQVFEHCPYCSLETHAPGVPPSMPALIPVSRPGGLLPPSFRDAPRPPPTGVNARPRGPPVLA